MSTYIEYPLDDGTTLLIEAAEEPGGGMVKAGRDADGNLIKRAGMTFQEALAGVKASARLLRQQLSELRADEVEVTFGLKAVGEAGVFGISKVGAEASYQVRLKWRGEEGR